MGSTDLVSPVSSSDGDDVDLGQSDGSSNGGGNFLGALDSKSDVSVSVSNDDEGFESGSLTGSGLLLDGHDLHDFVLEGGLTEKLVDDLELFDGESEEVDFFDLLNVSLLN